MIVIETILVAFSMFSRIPMYQIEWNEKNMRYALVAFPLVGVVIGCLCYAGYYVCHQYTIPNIFTGALLCSIPFWITGGIHLDGYMDTMDALSSHKSMDEKLEIMKDPHIGSFAVCHVVFLLLWNFILWTLIPELKIWWFVLLFMFSRCLSGLAVCSFPMAKNTGLAQTFASEAIKGRAQGALLIFSVVVSCGFVFMGWRGLVTMALGWCMFGFYYFFSKKLFGGITGDLAGWFLTLTETLLLLWTVVGGLL